jgi:hypothetical protein
VRGQGKSAGMRAYLNDMPYWATLSYPDFHTRVTSQAFVACSRHDKKAETALPPTVESQQLFRHSDDAAQRPRCKSRHGRRIEYKQSVCEGDGGPRVQCDTGRELTHLTECVIWGLLEPCLGRLRGGREGSRRQRRQRRRG